MCVRGCILRSLLLCLIIAGSACNNPRQSICQVWSFKSFRLFTTITCSKQGTGFVIAPDTIITCAHVVLYGVPSWMSFAKADSVLCYFPDDTVKAKVIRINERKDLAWLYVPNLKHRPLPKRSIKLRNTTINHLGTYVMVLGYPNGIWQVIKIRVMEPDTTGKIVAFMDDRCSIAGASGSPVFYRGWVVGILQEQGYKGYTQKRFIRFLMIK